MQREGDRSGQAAGATLRAAWYAAMLDNLRVQTNPRYERGRQGRDGTCCNLFVADATRALGAPIPELVKRRGAPTHYLNANAMRDWLFREGAALG